MKRQNETILVIEDDPDDRILIERAFQRLEAKVILQMLPNGVEAIAYLNGEGKYSDREQFNFPTMVITDLKLPGVNGFTVLKHLKSNPEWAVIPTMVLSGSSDTDDIKKAYLAGANAYLIKPAEFQALQALVENLFNFWSEVEVPQIHPSGKMKRTESAGKLSENSDTF